MSSFVSPQRRPQKPSDPLTADKAAMPVGPLPAAASHPSASAAHPLAPIPLFRPVAHVSAIGPTSFGEPTDTEEREASATVGERSEATKGMVQARRSVKQFGADSAAATTPNGGRALPIQRKITIGLPDMRRSGIAPNAAILGTGIVPATAFPGGPVIQRAYVGADAKEDVALFPKVEVADEKIDLTPTAVAAKAGNLGITDTNLKHYLNRHTFKYQPLSSSSTFAPQTGMFPVNSDKDAVKSMVVEAISLVPDGTVIDPTNPVSTAVTLANGLRVNLGALKSTGKLEAFFPIAGTGFHEYTNVELRAIKVEKDILEKPEKDKKAKELKDKQDARDAANALKAAKNKAFLDAKKAAAAAATTVKTP